MSAIPIPAVSTGSGVDVQVTVKALHLALCDVLLVPARLSIDLSMSDAAGPPVLYRVEGGATVVMDLSLPGDTMALFRVFIRNAVTLSSVYSLLRLVRVSCHPRHTNLYILYCTRIKNCSRFPSFSLVLSFLLYYFLFSLSLLYFSIFPFLFPSISLLFFFLLFSIFLFIPFPSFSAFCSLSFLLSPLSFLYLSFFSPFFSLFFLLSYSFSSLFSFLISFLHSLYFLVTSFASFCVSSFPLLPTISSFFLSLE